MQILSFDTSGSDVQIALMQDGRTVLERRLPPPAKSRQESASMLLPGIDAALKEVGWSKSGLDLLVVGVGPGSFTGVRVAVITARTIGQALNLGVLPVSSLEIMAQKADAPCVIVLNAGAGKYYAGSCAAVLNASVGKYSAGACTAGAPAARRLREITETMCSTAEEIQSKFNTIQNWVLEPGLQDLFPPDGKTITIYPTDANLASDAVALAYQRISDNHPNVTRECLEKAYPWDNVLPLYLRSPSVTLKASNGGSKNQTIAGG